MVKAGKPKARIGRPPKGDKAMKQIAIRVSDDMLVEIDEVIAARYGQADRTAVIREATIIGLQVLRGRAELRTK